MRYTNSRLTVGSILSTVSGCHGMCGCMRASKTAKAYPNVKYCCPTPPMVRAPFARYPQRKLYCAPKGYGYPRIWGGVPTYPATR